MRPDTSELERVQIRVRYRLLGKVMVKQDAGQRLGIALQDTDGFAGAGRHTCDNPTGSHSRNV